MLLKLSMDFHIDTELLRLRFVDGADDECFYCRHDGMDYVVGIPRRCDFDQLSHLRAAHLFLTKVLRHAGKVVLVPMVCEAARKFDLRMQHVTIKDMWSRWGSCSSLGNVNLSMWLLLAPKELVEYVILHEMAHLNEMNHSPRFWAQVDAFYGRPGRGKAMERQMKAFATRLRPMLLRDK